MNLKKIVPIVAIVAAFIVIVETYAFYYYKKATTALDDDSQTLNNRNFFKQFKKSAVQKLQQGQQQQVPPVITYSVKHTLNLNQLTEINQAKNQNIEVNCECDVQTIYNEEANIFEIAVSYSKIDKHISDEKTEIEQEEQQNTNRRNLNEEEGTTVEEGEEVLQFSHSEKIKQNNERFFLVQVEADSGKVLGIQAEKYYEEDQTITWITEHLVNDIFPELRKGSFEKTVQEKDGLGTISVDYTLTNNDSENLEINKEYKDEDYTELNIEHLSQPDIVYDRNITVSVDSGITKIGNTLFNFQMGDLNAQKLSQDQEDSKVQVEALGEMIGNIQQTFKLIESKENIENISQEIFRYRSEAEFYTVQLSSEKTAQITYGDGKTESEFELIDFQETTEYIQAEDDEEQQSEQSEQSVSEQNQDKQRILRGLQDTQFSKNEELAGIKIFGSRVYVDFTYTGTAATSTLRADLKVNQHLMKNLVNVSWSNCKPSFRDKQEEKSITLFKATFPLLGIIVIPIEAKTKMYYGYTKTVSQRARHCGIAFKPYFRVSLFASGKASIADIISAGIYSEGTFLNAELVLSAQVNAGKTEISLGGNMKSVVLDIGATYTKISCSIKNTQRRQRRNLKFGLKKLTRPVKKITKKTIMPIQPKKVVKVVKTTAKVVYRTYKLAVNLYKLCSFTDGFKKIYSKSSSTKYKSFYSKTLNQGL